MAIEVDVDVPVWGVVVPADSVVVDVVDLGP
jgi:hypothetical protein